MIYGEKTKKMSEKPIVLMPEDVQRILGKDAQRT